MSPNVCNPIVINSSESLIHDGTRAPSSPLRRLALSLNPPEVADANTMCCALKTHKSIFNTARFYGHTVSRDLRVSCHRVGFKGTATGCLIVTMSADPAASRQRFFAYIQEVVVGVSIPCQLPCVAFISLMNVAEGTRASRA